MRTSTKSRQYAKVLLDLAEQQKILEDVYRSLVEFQAVYRHEPRLKAALASTQIPAAKKAALLSGVFPSLHPLNNAFIVELAEKQDLRLIYEIVHQVELGYYQRSNQVRVQATATTALSAEVESRIRQAVETVTRKRADFSTAVDEDMLGGLKLRVGNTILDGSLASRLEQIRDHLKEL